MASMKLKAGAFRYGVGTGSSGTVGSRGGMQHGGHGGGGGAGGGGQVMGLRGNGEGDVPGRSSGGIGKRYGAGSKYSKSNRYRGLGAEAPETILTTSDPVGMWVKALQTMFVDDPTKDVPTGVWDFKTHQDWIKWLSVIYGVSDASKFPGWRQDPGFTAFFVIEMFFGGFELDRAFLQMHDFYEALGLPTSSRGEAINAFTSPANAQRMRLVLDRVTRYIIGCEGGKVYGDPMVQYKGIGSAIADVVLGIGLVALL